MICGLVAFDSLRQNPSQPTPPHPKKTPSFGRISSSTATGPVVAAVSSQRRSFHTTRDPCTAARCSSWSVWFQSSARTTLNATPPPLFSSSLCLSLAPAGIGGTATRTRSTPTATRCPRSTRPSGFFPTTSPSPTASSSMPSRNSETGLAASLSLSRPKGAHGAQKKCKGLPMNSHRWTAV